MRKYGHKLRCSGNKTRYGFVDFGSLRALTPAVRPERSILDIEHYAIQGPLESIGEGLFISAPIKK